MSARHFRHIARATVSQLLGRRPRSSLAAVVGAELRDALADLGPTFIKLGQVLSTRADLVPPTLASSLSTLQDAAPPVPVSAISAAIAAALGAAPAALFSSFDEQPLAAASIGQVHAAVLPDGREVVVKVRRPGVEQSVEIDLSILGRTARAIASLRAFRDVDVIGFVEEFATTIRAELDYVNEAHNAERARATLERHGVHVPEVVWTLSRGGVLTLERIRGAKVNDVAALVSLGIDPGRVARSLAETYLSMVFEDGFFHADPHPGNLFVEDSGRLAMVDFGMMGVVAPEIRRALVEILLGLATGDQLRNVRALRDLGVLPPSVSDADLACELEPIARATVELPLGELRLAPLLAQLMAVIRRRHLRFPRELALLVKTIVMCEGLAAQLDEGFSLSAVIIPFVAQGLLSAPPVLPAPPDDR